ncbi:glycosyltransferase [Brachybacterium sp. EF45031]|uniref:glycosyltransferase n=1 Tax=Brachybacterium sillae TaxID=2810536 RepID=UPI00217CC59D|nr:glycosyltransferase [Brachybacterium sillae]MCS6712041.1 glycosyltransferase [Brachybacterium sillae]
MTPPAEVLTAHRPRAVAVVIPAKDEAERIEATVRAARELPQVDLVVVVDDGSSDATSALAKGAGARVVRHPRNRGKAAAMETGARAVAHLERHEAPPPAEPTSAQPAAAEPTSAQPAAAEPTAAEPAAQPEGGPTPAVGPASAERIPRALLFLDADLGGSAAEAAPLIPAVLGEGVDMAIALLPPQPGAGGMGLVVGTARRGIERATGWRAQQPLSGIRCLTRECWDACQPLAAGWGVETSLTIDALTAGFWVKEIPCALQHRATGNDLSGRLHRAGQLRDVVRALARRRHLRPPEPEGEPEI